MAESEESATSRVCQVKMRGSGPNWSDEPCGRPIHNAPRGVDKEPVCLMHSKDPAKNDAEFQAEFERILAEAERTGTVADFFWFVFPSSNYSGRTFAPACHFVWAKFTQRADFTGATFSQDAHFNKATFSQAASFLQAKFTQDVSFFEARFKQNADFLEAKFTQAADFTAARFKQGAQFWGARFAQNANFPGTRFTLYANFPLTRFTQGANFGGARFTQDADFSGATFTQDANFSGAAFGQRVDFREATISEALRFRETRFRHDFSGERGPDFSGVKVEHPEQVEFYKTDLGQALFYNTDVSKMDFTLAEWRDRGRVARYRFRRGFFCWRRFFAIRRRKAWMKRWELLARVARPKKPRFCVFDEDVNLESARALRTSEKSGDERNYSLIAETYQQLKRNYDAKGDYWTAGHWHYGEIEMKRLHSRFRWKPLRWLSHHFSLVALYRYASAYGESYLMPLVWLVFFIAAFTFLYPIPGLEFNPPTGGTPGWLGYMDWTTFFRSHPAEHPFGFSGMILHSLMTSLSVAGFQRELRYAPNYPWGRMLALLELPLTTTLGGLFLLAIRRQFKRS